MSKRHALAQRLHTFGELREIMSAMKNIALMESRKLAGLLDSQREILGLMEQAAGDFFAGHPRLQSDDGESPTLVIAVGSERGFCGDFNESVLRRLGDVPSPAGAPPSIVLVGSRLAQREEGLAGIVARVEGPAMIEEVRPALSRLLAALTERPELAAAFTLHRIAIVHHQPHAEGTDVRVYRPREAFSRSAATGRQPARLLLPAGEFLEQLIEHYLHAVFYSVFYDSLAAENQRRVAHMQAAVDRMDERIAAGRLRMNALRQEEITEQIEEIMLSADALLPGPGSAH
jgi:F-type H+-transporting ATPase subunit gamma